MILFAATINNHRFGHVRISLITLWFNRTRMTMMICFLLEVKEHYFSPNCVILQIRAIPPWSAGVAGVAATSLAASRKSRHGPGSVSIALVCLDIRQKTKKTVWEKLSRALVATPVNRC